MDDVDILSYLLAAERDATVTDLPEYAEALRRVQADPALAAAVEAERAFYRDRDGLLDEAGMPAEVRARLQAWVDATLNPQAEDSLDEPERAPTPSVPVARSPRNLLPLAAAIGLLLGGAALVLEMNRRNHTQQHIVQLTIDDFDAFRKFGSACVVKGVKLEHHSPVMQVNSKFLADHGACACENLMQDLASQKAMGCAIYEVDGMKISLICMEMEGKQLVHLFAARRTWKGKDPANSIKVVNGRETRAWQDDRYAYLLVAHDAGQRLGSG
jgi:hypothetical protein